MKKNNIHKIPRGYDPDGKKHSFINFVDRETKERTTLDIHDEWLYTESERDQAYKDGTKYGAALGAWVTLATCYAITWVVDNWDEISYWGRSAKQAIVSKIKALKEKKTEKDESEKD